MDTLGLGRPGEREGDSGTKGAECWGGREGVLGRRVEAQPHRALRGSVLRNLPQGCFRAVWPGPSDSTTLDLSFPTGNRRIKTAQVWEWP